MRAAAAICALALLAGCAGLAVDWVLQGQMVYRSKPPPVEVKKDTSL